MNLIEILKNNISCFGLCSEEEQKCFRDVGIENCEERWYDKWQNPHLDYFDDDNTYHIKSDYQSELEIERCPVETKNGNIFYFRNSNPIRLYKALADPDFIAPIDKDGDTMSLRPYTTSLTEPAPIPFALLFRKSKLME